MTASHSFFLRGIFLLLVVIRATPLFIEDRNLQTETPAPTNTLFPAAPEPITEGVQEALDEAWGLWNSSGLVAYELGFTRLCFCTDEFTAPYTSVVENGMIVEVLDTNNATLVDSGSPLFQEAYSVEILFARIQAGLDEGAYEIRVEYNETYGYPTSVYIDYDSRIADEEFNVVVDFFQLGNGAIEGGQTSSPSYDADQAQEALDEAWGLWNSSGLVAYELGFTRLCFCTDEYRAPYISIVENGGIVEVLDTNATLVDSNSSLFQDAYSVESLFAVIQGGLDVGAYEIRVDYDAVYGYPTSVYIDYDSRMADEEFNVVVNSFESMEETTNGEQPDDGTDVEADKEVDEEDLGGATDGEQTDAVTDGENSGAATLRLATLPLAVALWTAMFG